MQLRALGRFSVTRRMCREGKARVVKEVFGGSVENWGMSKRSQRNELARVGRESSLGQICMGSLQS